MMSGIRHFDLIKEGDHILIGVSGGKDSLALLEFLGDAKKRAGEKFKLSAAHIRMDNINYASETGYLEEQAQKVGIPLYICTGNFEPDRNIKRTPCFLCSWTRRKMLFKLAQDLGCNKIALGHHQDDILQTALMNITFSGSFSTMPALIEMKKFPISIIRPFCETQEKDLKSWANIQHYQPMKKECPYDKSSNRTTIKKIFNDLETINPEFRYSFWHALCKQNVLIERHSTFPT